MDDTRQQIRGSSMLLAGRFLGTAINFAAQVSLVRYLSKSDYGAWAYAVGLVGFFHIFVSLGLDKVVDRFVPIYHENRQYGRLFGTILTALFVIFLTSAVVIGAFFLFPDFVSRWVKQDGPPILLIMVFVIPLDAIDMVMIRLFACFASPRAIFFRKHLLGPTLKLSVVLVLISLHGNLLVQAAGYVVASVVGVALCGLILIRTMRQRGLFESMRLSDIRIPGEIFRYTIPSLMSEWVDVIILYANVLLLGYFHSADAVAIFKVVLPVAAMNDVVYSTFSLLYTPGAARLFAKGDRAGMREMYWRTTIWTAVLTFPVFALTFGASVPLTTFLYGDRYAQSGLIMAIVSLGYYFQVALGLNSHTLRILGRLRYIVRVNLLSAGIALTLLLLLIPRYGAVGAAIATAGSMIAQHAMRHAALHLAFGGHLFERRYLRFYLVLGPSIAALVAIHLLDAGSIYMSGLLSAAVSLWLIYVCRNFLRLGQTFPELFRLPLVQWCARMARAR
jgi:O-antigen/teichoic acid export membrane protein